MRRGSDWATCLICERRFRNTGGESPAICERCAREMARPPAPMTDAEIKKVLANYLAAGGTPSGVVGIIRAHVAWRVANGLPLAITADTLEGGG